MIFHDEPVLKDMMGPYTRDNSAKERKTLGLSWRIFPIMGHVQGPGGRFCVNLCNMIMRVSRMARISTAIEDVENKCLLHMQS